MSRATKIMLIASGTILLVAISFFVLAELFLSSEDFLVSERTLIDEGLGFLRPELRDLQRKKVKLEGIKIDTEIQEEEAKQEAIALDRRYAPVWKHVTLGSIIGLVVAMGMSWVIFATLKGIGALREKSMIPQKIGDNTLCVHYSVAKSREFAHYIGGLVQVEGLKAQFPERALEMSGRLMDVWTNQTRALVGRRGLLALTNGNGHEQQELSLDATPATLNMPTFQQILDNLDAGDPMYLGVDVQSQEPVTATFDDLYSSYWAGHSGTGKSAWMAGFASQSVVAIPNITYYVLDPHQHKAESLTHRLPHTHHFHFMNPANPVNELMAFNGLLQARLDNDTGDVTPLVLMIDELGFLMRQKYSSTVKMLLERISTEGRGVKVFFLASNQDTRLRKNGDFRDTAASSFLFRLKPGLVRNVLQDTDEVNKHKEFIYKKSKAEAKGVVLFCPAEDESKVLKVPHFRMQDKGMIEAMYHQVNGSDVPVSDGNNRPHQTPQEAVRDEKSENMIEPTQGQDNGVKPKSVVSLETYKHQKEIQHPEAPGHPDKLTPDLCKVLRDHKHLTQGQVADLVKQLLPDSKITQKKVSRYEKNESDLDGKERACIWYILTEHSET